MQNVHQMEATSMLTLAVFEKDRIVGTREFRKKSVTIIAHYAECYYANCCLN